MFGRGSSAVRALDQISLEVAAGGVHLPDRGLGLRQVHAAVNLVAGLDQPTSGEVSVSAAGWRSCSRSPRCSRGSPRPATWSSPCGPAACGRAERRQRAAELLDTVHLAGFGGKRPHELSGGMRQRVALARALAQDADVLLMDEPFGALDAMTRDLLHDELDRVCAGRQLTILFVTHNVREAVRLGDRVVVLSSRPGRVIDEFAVPIERPRRIDSAPVAELAGRITDRLREEMSHGTR